MGVRRCRGRGLTPAGRSRPCSGETCLHQLPARADTGTGTELVAGCGAQVRSHSADIYIYWALAACQGLASGADGGAALLLPGP